MVPREDWKWFGNAGHFICAKWCRFHLCTQVGPWMISTVGEYVHPRHGGGSEREEAKWLEANYPGEDIGYNRKYETMVFRAEPCTDDGCKCAGHPVPLSWSEVDADGYNDNGAATEGHYAMCEKWADRPADFIPED